MKSALARVAVVGAAAAAALTLGLTSAASADSAVFTYTVAAGSAATGTSIPVTGTTFGTIPRVSFTDTTAGLPLTCDNSTLSGTTKTGTGLSGIRIASVTGTSASFTNCKGPFGLAFVVTGSSTWFIKAVGATNSIGGTAGAVSLISAHVADGTSCVFDVTGAISAGYRNAATQSTLTATGSAATLTLSNVSGSLCGLAGIKNGDKASFKASYIIKATNPAFNPVTINSDLTGSARQRTTGGAGVSRPRPCFPRGRQLCPRRRFVA